MTGSNLYYLYESGYAENKKAINRRTHKWN